MLELFIVFEQNKKLISFCVRDVCLFAIGIKAYHKWSVKWIISALKGIIFLPFEYFIGIQLNIIFAQLHVYYFICSLFLVLKATVRPQSASKYLFCLHILFQFIEMKCFIYIAVIGEAMLPICAV